jgi:hypothetical protein
MLEDPEAVSFDRILAPTGVDPEVARPARTGPRPAGPAPYGPTFSAISSGSISSNLQLFASIDPLGTSRADWTTTNPPQLQRSRPVAPTEGEVVQQQLSLLWQQQQQRQQLNSSLLLDPRLLAWLNLDTFNAPSYGPLPPGAAAGPGRLAGAVSLSAPLAGTDLAQLLLLPAAGVDAPRRRYDSSFSRPPGILDSDSMSLAMGLGGEWNYWRDVEVMVQRQRDRAALGHQLQRRQQQLATALSVLAPRLNPNAAAEAEAEAEAAEAAAAAAAAAAREALPERGAGTNPSDAAPEPAPERHDWDVSSSSRGAAAVVGAVAPPGAPAAPCVPANTTRGAAEAAASSTTAATTCAGRKRRRRLRHCSGSEAGLGGGGASFSSPPTEAGRQPPAVATMASSKREKRRRRSASSSSEPGDHSSRRRTRAARRGRAVLMFRGADDDASHVSGYQCLLRRQIEYFEADGADLLAKAQGRCLPIHLGQVGIRCVHCAARSSSSCTSGACQATRTGARGMNRGAAYYPSSLAFLYQAVQNMANNHFVNRKCPSAPPSILDEIIEARRARPHRSGGGSGKRFFGRSAESLGIVDAPEGPGLVMLSASRRTAASALAVPISPGGTPSRRELRGPVAV